MNFLKSFIAQKKRKKFAKVVSECYSDILFKSPIYGLVYREGRSYKEFQKHLRLLIYAKCADCAEGK